MIRLGLIGCGEHSEIGHAVPLARYKAEHPAEVELAAVCDFRAERAHLFCRKYGFNGAYNDLEKMLAEQELDICVAVVPVKSISQVGIQLLERGMPCGIEKPLGASIGEVKALLEAARKTGTRHMVSVNRRFMPFLNRAMEWAKNAGELRYVRCIMSRHGRSEPEFLWETAVHAVDALRHIGGQIRRSDMRVMKNANRSAEWYALDLEFVSGLLGRIDVLPTAGLLEETYELIGEGFRAIVTSPFGPERGWRGFRENRIVVEESAKGIPEEIINGFYHEAAALLRAMVCGEPLHPSIEDVYPSVELCMALANAAGKIATAAL